MTTTTDQRAEELAELDNKMKELAALKAKQWPLFCSLLVDEMIAKGTAVGLDDPKTAVSYCFRNHLQLTLEHEGYFSQINDRLVDARSSLEPFATYLNRELANRGIPLRLDGQDGWYASQLVSL